MKSSELKPGVSATSPLPIAINSTCLVVCFPRPKCEEYHSFSVLILDVRR